MRTLLAAVLCVTALFAAGDRSNRRAPGFALFDSSMKVYDLADYRGKVVVLELMQTDCPHCGAFAEVLSQIPKKYGDKVAVLAVVNSSHDNANTIARYVSQHRVTYPVLFDAGQMAYSYVLSLNFTNPYVFLIDGNGVIRKDFQYSVPNSQMFEAKTFFAQIDEVLKSATGAPFRN